MINDFNLFSDSKLTNIISCYHLCDALSVEEYERINGAVKLKKEEIKHRILVIKINRVY